jgi:hypothetical protein
MPAGAIGRWVDGAGDRMVAAVAVAAAASRTTAMNPLIVRCFVMKTSLCLIEGIHIKRLFLDIFFGLKKWLRRSVRIVSSLATNETASRDRDWQSLTAARQRGKQDGFALTHPPPTFGPQNASMS